MTLVLVTGGVRSGKSAFAESLLADDAPATYLATGEERGDEDWQQRVRAHQERRPATWSSRATGDPSSALAQISGPVLLDCLGTWLARTLDDLDAWEAPRSDWSDALTERRRTLIEALAGHEDHCVVVTNEVGWGVVPAYRSGRIFTDELGLLNQEVAAQADAVVLCVSGIPLTVAGQLPPEPLR